MNNILKTTVVAGFAAMLGSASLMAQEAAAPAAAPAQECQKAWTKPSLDDLKASVSVGYESMYIFRGKAQTIDNIQASLDIGYAVTDALGIYGGVWHNSPLSEHAGAGDWTDTQLSAGVTYGVAGFIFDAGYTSYWYNGARPSFNSTNEVKAGVLYDTSAILGKYLGGATIVPSAYYYYDFDRMSNTVEVAISASLPVSKWAFGKDFLSVEASVFYGYLTEDRQNFLGDLARETNSYNYVGVTADLVWKVNDICAVKGGVRWAANDDGDKYGRNQYFYSDNNLWWGMSVVIGF